LTNRQKKGRPRSENPMVHTAIALPRDLLERLKKDAEASDRGLSTEIRYRLNQSYDQEGPSDPQTTDLVAAIKRLADNLASGLGMKWHQHRYVLAAFKTGVALFLAQCQPEGDESTPPDTVSVFGEFKPRDAGEPHDPPDAVGRTHARFIMASQSAVAAQRAGAAPEPEDE
jgi:hypothetical protein